MFSEPLPRLFSEEVGVIDAAPHERRSIPAWIHEAVCGIGGHSFMLHAEHDRLFLRCEGCGHETPGWAIETRPARHARPH